MELAARSTSGIHAAVQRIRGKACEFDCVDCGFTASDWSHTHDTDPYDSDNYQPRCRSCHKQYDRSRQRLSDDDVIEIRRLSEKNGGPYNYPQLAEIFGTTKFHIDRIVNRKQRTYHTK